MRSDNLILLLLHIIMKDEWTYFEHGGGFKEHESLLRWIQLLPKQPPLHIFNTGVNQKNGNDAKLVEYYARYGFNAFYMRTGFMNGGHDYEADEANDINRL